MCNTTSSRLHRESDSNEDSYLMVMLVCSGHADDQVFQEIKHINVTYLKKLPITE